MESEIPLAGPGGLASITTNGMPLTNRVTSGRMFGAWPGVATRNCEIAKKSLALQLSQSIKSTVCCLPPTQPSSPSTVTPLSRSSVDLWLASNSLVPGGVVFNSEIAALMRVSSSQGRPSGPGLILFSTWASRFSRITSLPEERSTWWEGRRSDQISVSQPSAARCSRRGRSTLSHSGPEVMPPPF